MLQAGMIKCNAKGRNCIEGRADTNEDMVRIPGTFGGQVSIT